MALPPWGHFLKSLDLVHFISYLGGIYFKAASLHVAQVCLSYVGPVADIADREERPCALPAEEAERQPRRRRRCVLLRAGHPTPRARTVVEVRPHPDLSSTHKRKQTHADAVTRDRMRALAPPISRPRRPPARSPAAQGTSSPYFSRSPRRP